MIAGGTGLDGAVTGWVPSILDDYNPFETCDEVAHNQLQGLRLAWRYAKRETAFLIAIQICHPPLAFRSMEDRLRSLEANGITIKLEQVDQDLHYWVMDIKLPYLEGVNEVKDITVQPLHGQYFPTPHDAYTDAVPRAVWAMHAQSLIHKAKRKTQS